MNYALIALGLTLIFAIMNVLNFAHGQMYVLGGFITYYALQVLNLPFVVGLVASVVVLVLVAYYLSGCCSDGLSAFLPVKRAPCCSLLAWRCCWKV